MNEGSEVVSGRQICKSSTGDMARLGLTLPEDVKLSLSRIFSDCNFVLARQISIFPNTHEETLDQLLVTHLAQMQGPIKFGSGWVMRLDTHFIGGGRHYRNWEVADIGLMVVFRRKGRVVRSKLVFLQSKRLYADTQRFEGVDPYHRIGMGRLLVTDEEHQELIEKKTIKFSENCKYKALQSKDDQSDAIEGFAQEHGVDIFYLFYNPALMPWSTVSPVEQSPVIEKNLVGCRVVPQKILSLKLAGEAKSYSPSYQDVLDLSTEKMEGADVSAGWRWEYFVNDLFIACKKGKINDSPNFKVLTNLMSQKSSPISSAISISFDLDA